MGDVEGDGKIRRTDVCQATYRLQSQPLRDCFAGWPESGKTTRAEGENIFFFGPAYQKYMHQTKMFIPFIVWADQKQIPVESQEYSRNSPIRLIRDKKNHNYI